MYRASADGVDRVAINGSGIRTERMAPASSLDVRFAFEGREPDTARSVVVTIAWSEPPRIGISEAILSLRVALRQGALRKGGRG